MFVLMDDWVNKYMRWMICDHHLGEVKTDSTLGAMGRKPDAENESLVIDLPSICEQLPVILKL